MVLRIIIRLIVVIMHIPELVIVLSCRIVSTVGLILFEADAFPCDSRPLVAHEPCQTQGIPLIDPAQYSHG